ncbi:hypothetical protein AVEN_44574-1 [Araneus ventricosus]|uniref:Uncharacterized protein n=1 Tax=Araneus ventricosus TaxID=182803 RepID=A0A4Y2IK67_ARAVE|nr:hypothetical protein AVEN_44574-1 [Araneus ventricosus]
MAVWNVLKDWGLEDKAQILCSDTTSSNTGRINGAITFLESYADREGHPNVTLRGVRQYLVEAIVNEIVAKSGGLKVDSNDINELAEERKQELATEELMELHYVSQ